MKKYLPALLLGLVVGVVATLLLTRHEAETPKSEEPPPGLHTVINPDTATIVKQMAAVGLTTATPAETQLTPETKAYGRVLDPTPLLTLFAEITAGEAAATASEKEFDRTKSLYDQNRNASLQAVETARAAMLRDRVQLGSAQARFAAGWGSPLITHNDLAGLLTELATGKVAIVRIDIPPGETAAASPKSARVSAVTGDPDWQSVELLGPAPSTESQLGGQSYLGLWPNAPLRPGAALRAVLAGPGAPRKVLVVPGSAIVRHQGGSFVYIQTDEHGFDRRMVTLGPTTAGGTVITDGVTGTDKVVITGAQQLLATEVMGSSPPEE